MKIGEMRHRVTISNPTSTSDVFGQPIESYTVTTHRWARVTEDEVGEQQIDDGTVAKKRIRVTIRSLGTKVISERSRIGYNGATFNVVSVSDPEGEAKVLLVVAERGD